MFSEIEELINSKLDIYFDNVEKKTGVKKTLLKEIWKDSLENRKPNIVKATVVEDAPVEEICSHVLKRGKNAGKRCKKKPRSGKKYCSLHKKYENKESKEESKERISPSPSHPKNPVILLNKKFNLYEHKKSGMLFDKKSKIVVGKVQNDSFLESSLFEKDDIELCEKLRFKVAKKKTPVSEQKDLKDLGKYSVNIVLPSDLEKEKYLKDLEDAENILKELRF